LANAAIEYAVYRLGNLVSVSMHEKSPGNLRIQYNSVSPRTIPNSRHSRVIKRRPADVLAERAMRKRGKFMS